MEYNVLILSVGRRVELVKRFQRAAKELNITSKVVGVDINELAPALYFCDEKELIPRIDDEKYIDALIQVCKKHQIKLMIPTIDTELQKIAESVKQFEDIGVTVNISSLEVIQICRNKKNTQKWLEENGFLAPKMISEEEIQKHQYSFPLFIKPLDGSSSINAFSIHNEEELAFFQKYVPRPIIQEMITGKEYTIDVFCDFNSNPITIVPRERLVVRAGEILKGRIEKNTIIIQEIKRLLMALKPKGHITIQCMKDEKDRVYIIEINPRFGGGAPMSIDAGANSPKYLFQIVMGETLSYHEDYQDDIYFSRFDDTLMIKPKIMEK